MLAMIPRWAKIASAILVALTITYAAAWWHGKQRWQAALAEAEAAGFATRPSQLIAKRPPTDRTRLLTLLRIVEDAGKLPDDVDDAYWAPERTAAERAAYLAQAGPIIDDFIATTEGEPVWLAADVGSLLPDADRQRVETTAAIAMPNLLGARNLAQAAEALWATGDERGRICLDRLDRALSKPVVLIDLMTAVAIGKMRDAVMLRRLLAGVHDAGQTARWIAEPIGRRWTGLGADAFAAEQALFNFPLTTHGIPPDAAAMSLSYHRYSAFERILWHAAWYGFLPILRWHEGAFSLQFHQALRRSLLYGEAPPIVQRSVWRHPITPVSLPNLLPCGEMLVQADLAARLHRAAAAIVFAHRRDGALPADLAAVARIAPAGLLDAAGHQPALVYERLAPTRFRIGIPSAASGPLLPNALVSAQTRIGQPAGTHALHDDRFSIEIDVSQPHSVHPVP